MAVEPCVMFVLCNKQLYIYNVRYIQLYCYNDPYLRVRVTGILAHLFISPPLCLAPLLISLLLILV